MEIFKIVLSMVVGVLAGVVGVVIYKRNTKEALNKLFFAAFLAFMVFFVCDAMVGILYFNWAAANLSRDISSSSALFGCLFVFFGSYLVWQGKNQLKSKKFLLPILLVIVIGIIIGQSDEVVEVNLAEQSYTLQKGLWALLFNHVLQLVIIAASVVIYRKVIILTEDPNVKFRLKLIIVSLSVVVAGQLLQALLLAIIPESVYYSLIYPDAIVYSLWGVGVFVALRAFWR